MEMAFTCRCISIFRALPFTFQNYPLLFHRKDGRDCVGLPFLCFELILNVEMQPDQVFGDSR